jgi:hypothetical protein
MAATPCPEVCADGVHLGGTPDLEVHCLHEERCKVRGSCFWREWHALGPDKFRRRDVQQPELPL